MLFFTTFSKLLQGVIFSSLAINSPNVTAPEADEGAAEDAVERAAWYQCSTSSSTPGQRQAGRIRVKEGDPTTCEREHLGIQDTESRVPCHQLAKGLGCTMVEDIN